MKKIIVTLADGTVKELVSESVKSPVEFAWGYNIELCQPVTIANSKLEEGMNTDFGNGTLIQFENEETFYGSAKLITTDEGVYLRIFTESANATILQQGVVNNRNDGIGAFSGSVGPFKYMIDVHLDIENPTKSEFIVKLSFESMKLLDVCLNDRNSEVKIDASIFGVGVTGLLGVDFERKRVYVSATLNYFFGKKKYNFDLYNWENNAVKMLPVLQGSEKNLLLALNTLKNENTVGSITIKNKGAYVAKFKVSYTVDGQRLVKESGNFTAGVNKQIDIPANASDIHIEALAAWFICSWSTIFTEVYKEPIRIVYEISGTTLNTSWKVLER